jgi:transposase InsO family protein
LDKKNEQWAVFWCDLLQPVIYGEISPEETNRYLKTLSREKMVYPDGQCRKPSLSSLKRKLFAYRTCGFDGLARKPRTDRGKSRNVSEGIIETAIELKKEQPYRSDVVINRLLEEKFGQTIPRSSLYRVLKEAGATRRKLGVTTRPVRKRWSRENSNDLWIGDFEEGPYVINGSDVVPTYLSAFIDCHSRYVVTARYYYRQNLDVLIDSLLRALAVHGMPLGLYVDNAKVYHANGLKAACYRAGIRLMYRKIRDPAGGGIIERLFQTIQNRFEAEVKANDILSLDEINRFLAAFIAQDYHKALHSEIRNTPEKAYKEGLRVVRQMDLNAFCTSFMQRAERTVHTTFADVQLHRRYYKTDPRLRGDRVEVRYDPFSSQDTVQIYSLKGVFLADGRLHQRTETDPVLPAKKLEKPAGNYLNLLDRQHQKDLSTKTGGIDYRKTATSRPWPFHEFARLVADLLGEKGGLGAFNAQELEVLKKTWNMHTGINKGMVQKACAAATHKSIPHVIRELKTLFIQGE